MKCIVCGHKKINEIEQLIREGVPYQDIASRFGISVGSIARHKKLHMPAREIEVKGLEAVQEYLNVALQRARETQNWLYALTAIEKYQAIKSLQERQTGENEYVR
jgi:hypothetical protein